MKLILLALAVGAAVARPNGFQNGFQQPGQPQPQPGSEAADDEMRVDLAGEIQSPDTLINAFDEVPAMPTTQRKGFMKYLDGLRKIFANPDNHAKLQQFYQSPEMRQWFFQRFHKRPSVPFPAHLRTNYQDSVFSKDEFMAWYPTLLQLAKTMNMEPVVSEEWGVIGGDGQGITPEKLWVMLRDGVANKFFPSFMTLAFSESTKHMPGPFWSLAKRDAFQRGVWGQIAGLRPISDKAIKQLADEIEKMQGEETAEKFMVDMGMGELSGNSLPVQTKDGQGQVDIKVEDPNTQEDEVNEPIIEAATPIMTTDGQQMPAAKVAEDETLTPVEGAPVPVKMPNGQVVMMSLGEEKSDDEPQPMATLEAASGEKFQMPVVETTANDDGTSTTKVMTPEGTVMEVSVPTPKEELSGTANDETLGGVVAGPATIEDKAKGLEIPASASPADPTTEAADDACIGLDACKPTEITANGIKMTIPVKTEESDELTMTVENVQTGQAVEMKEVESEFDEATGTLTIEGKTADGTKMEIEIPASQPLDLQNEEGFGEESQPEIPAGVNGEVTIKSDNDEPLITAKVQSIESTKLPNGARETTLTGNINGSPTKITITSGEPKEAAPAAPTDIVQPEDLSADEMANMQMEVQIEGKPAQKIPVVQATEDEITGQMTDGTLVKVPTPEKASDGEDDEMELVSPSGQKLELPILSAQTTPDKSAEQLIASNGQAKMTVTVTGA